MDSDHVLFGSGGDDLAARIQGLEWALAASRGHLSEDVLDEAEEVVQRARSRLRLSAEHTIVALAGATGSGKSSLFNQLTDLELAAVGVRRPTTSWAMACAWGPTGAEEILEWLGIPPRHQVSRMSMLDISPEETNMQGLVLLDLPDHDSTEVAHHLEVKRLVSYADLLVWVVDPQKYADAAIHDGYLAPLSTHAEVMLVVFNHLDEIPVLEREATLADLRRLLAIDGLSEIPLVATSAKTGEGIDDLKRALVKRIRAKRSAADRLTADAANATGRLVEANGMDDPRGLDERRQAALVDVLAEAAGVPVVVEAVEFSTAARRRRSTSWPATRWLSRFRRDPLAELRLGGGSSSDLHSAMPPPTKVQQARVDVAVRDLADDAAQGLAPPWADAVSRASTSDFDDLHDALDKAIASTDLGVTRKPAWVRILGIVQWLLFVAAVAGAGWLITLGVMDLAGSDAPEPPTVGSVSVPLLMALVGFVLGICLGLAARLAVDVSGRRTADQASDALHQSIATVAHQRIFAP
ncbi:MAG TPA: GTPase, partial [Nocardioidaceae bacterium]|nr:GTPase [Nocardioidaceae bacterium]